MDKRIDNSTIVFLDKHSYNQLEYGKLKDNKLYIYSISSKCLFNIYHPISLECSNDDSELEYAVYVKMKEQQTVGTFKTVLGSKVCKLCISKGENFVFESKECEHCSIEKEESVHNLEEGVPKLEGSIEEAQSPIKEECDNWVTMGIDKWDYIYQTEDKNIIDTIKNKKTFVSKPEEYLIYGTENTHKTDVKLERYSETEHEFKIYDHDLEDQYISEPESEKEEYYSMDSSSEEALLSNSGYNTEDMSQYSAKCNISNTVLKDTIFNTFNVVKVECGYLIANKVMLSDYNWHTIIVNSHEVLCAICKMKFNPALIPQHIQTDKHKSFLSLYAPLDKYEFSITRKIGAKFHCGVCNKLYSEDDLKKHINEPFHSESLKYAMEIVSSYPKHLTEDNLCVILIFPKIQVKIPLENWNMAYNVHTSFYCLLCNKSYPTVSMKEHFSDVRHRENLFGCRLVSQYEEHTLREMDSTSLHCSVCNVSLHKMQMQMHISSSTHLEAVHKYTAILYDAPRWRPIEFAMLMVFGTAVYVNKYDLHTIIYQFCNAICALCNMILRKDDINTHLNTLYHIAKMQAIPFLPLYGLNLIRMINMNTLHCCVCNVLLPNLVDPLHQHIHSVRHLLFKRRMLTPHAAVNSNLKNITNKKEVKIEDVGFGCSNSVESKDAKSAEIIKEETGKDIKEGPLNTKTETNMKNETSTLEIKSTRDKVVMGEFQSNGPKANIEEADVKCGNKSVNTAVTVNKLKKNKGSRDEQPKPKSSLKKVIRNEILKSEFQKHDTDLKQIIEKKKVHGAVMDDTKKKSPEIDVPKEINIEITNDDKFEKEDIEIEVIGRFLDDFKDFYSTTEINGEEFINVKFNETYMKILRVSWDTLVDCYEDVRCLVCKFVIFDNKSAHIHDLEHQENIMKKGFLQKYDENLIRKFDKLYHCGVCNLVVHDSVEHHIIWRVHRENLLLSKNTSEELNTVAEFKTSTVAKSKEILRKFKTVTIHAEDVDVALTIKWNNWESILATKNGFACILCQSEFHIDNLEEHVHSEVHKKCRAFPIKYGINLIREIDEQAMHCAICNKRLSKHCNVDVHIKGANHTKNLRTAKIPNDTI